MALPSIVHHTGLEDSGGATRVARLIADGLSMKGTDTRLTFELAAKNDGGTTKAHEFGTTLTAGEVAHIHCTGNWPGLLSSIPAGQPTVITLHDCELFTGGCPYPLGCQSLDADCATPCPRKFPDSDEMRKQKHHLIDAVNPHLVAPSRWLARLAKSHLFRHVTVIPNGIPWPTAPLKKAEARRQLGINPAARVAIFTAHGGMGAVYKSGQEWRNIWKQIKTQLPEALCFAAGGDTAGREENDLVVWPYVERHRLALLMAAADVLLYPTQADNHSLVILEAMSQALPAVAYGVGGIPEQVTDMETGCVVEPGNQEQFIEQAVGLLSRPMLIRDLGQHAFSMGQKRFHVDRMVDDYTRLYNNL